MTTEIKRRSNVVGIFAADEAAIRVIGAALADQLDEWATGRRYLSDTSMAGLSRPLETASSQPQPGADHTEVQPPNPTT